MSVHSITFSKYKKKKKSKKKLFPPHDTAQAQLPGQHANQNNLRDRAHQWPRMVSGPRPGAGASCRYQAVQALSVLLWSL